VGEPKDDQSLSRAPTGSYAALAAAATDYSQQKRAATAAPKRGKGREWAPDTQGRYDPLNHEWISAPTDPANQRLKERDGERILGLSGGIRCHLPNGGSTRTSDFDVSSADRAGMAHKPARNPITGAGINDEAPKTPNGSRAGPSW